MHHSDNSVILSKKISEKSGLKRDGPVFFSSAPVRVAGDENKIMVNVASRWGPNRKDGVSPFNPSITKNQIFFQDPKSVSIHMVENNGSSVTLVSGDLR